MEPNSNLISSLQRAVRAQDAKWLHQLIQDKSFSSLSGADLDKILTPYSVFFQEKDLIDPFASHPNFKEISPTSVGELFMASLRLDHGVATGKLIQLPQFAKIPTTMIRQMVQTTLQYQGRSLFNFLKENPLYAQEFDKNMEGMMECAIRTQNKEWLEELYRHPHYKQISDALFVALMRWVFRRRDRKLIGLAIRHQTFTEKRETILKQELFDSFLQKESEKREAIELFVVEQLLKHKEYLNFSPTMICWMVGKAITLKHKEIVDLLISHPHYTNIPSDALSEPLILALPDPDARYREILTTHPNFSKMSGAALGIVLEEAGRFNRKELLLKLIHHPQFEKVPEDSFKRLATLKIDSPDPEMRTWVLTEPAFRKKYGEMIYEAIRRNETGLIDQLFRDSILKEEVFQQLINYSTTESYYVSEYVIRDVIREGFMTGDDTLISAIAKNPLFKQRIRELMEQSIHYDDDELIEQMLLNKTLNPTFKEVLHTATQEDRNRLYRIFTSNPSFSKKSPLIVNEVRSWNILKQPEK